MLSAYIASRKLDSFIHKSWNWVCWSIPQVFDSFIYFFVTKNGIPRCQHRLPRPMSATLKPIREERRRSSVGMPSQCWIGKVGPDAYLIIGLFESIFHTLILITKIVGSFDPCRFDLHVQFHYVFRKISVFPDWAKVSKHLPTWGTHTHTLPCDMFSRAYTAFFLTHNRQNLHLKYENHL